MLVDDPDRLANELRGHIVTAISIHDRRVTVQLEATKRVRLICTNAVLVNSMMDCIALLRLASWDRCIVAARAITLSQRTILCYLALTNGAYLAILTEDIGLAYAPEGCPATPIRPEHPPSWGTRSGSDRYRLRLTAWVPFTSEGVMEHLRHSASHPPSSSLAPFYTRARRRRLVRAVRWPLIVGGSVLLVVIVVLAAGGFWFW